MSILDCNTHTIIIEIKPTFHTIGIRQILHIFYKYDILDFDHLLEDTFLILIFIFYAMLTRVQLNVQLYVLVTITTQKIRIIKQYFNFH